MRDFQFFDDAYYNHGAKDFCGFYDFMKPGLIIGDLQLIQNMLVRDFDFFADRRVLGLGKVTFSS